MITTLSINFLRCSKGANSIIGDGILTKFKLIKAFMVGFVTCKNDEDPLKMKALEWSQHFTHYKSMGIFPASQGQLTPQSKAQSGRISNLSEIL